MRRLEVRCCCDPDRLLGYLPCPVAKPSPGMAVTFMVRTPEVVAHSVQDGYWEPPTVTLPIGQLGDFPFATARTWLAYKSNETPIETLRRIPGFIEAGTHVG